MADVLDVISGNPALTTASIHISPLLPGQVSTFDPAATQDSAFGSVFTTTSVATGLSTINFDTPTIPLLPSFPISSSPSQSPTTSISVSLICGGCYGVAVVDEVISGTTIGTPALDTSTSVRLGEFAWSLTDSISVITSAGAPRNSALPSADVVAFNGTQFIVPSMANIFQSYQLVAEYLKGGVCTTSFLNFVLSTPFSVAIPTLASDDWISRAETSFIAQLPQTTCSTGMNGELIFKSSATEMTTGASLTTRIAVGVSVSLVGIVVFMILVVFLRRSRARKLQKISRSGLTAELPTNISKRIGELFASPFAWQAELESNSASREAMNSLPQELPTEWHRELEKDEIQGFPNRHPPFSWLQRAASSSLHGEAATQPQIKPLSRHEFGQEKQELL